MPDSVWEQTELETLVLADNGLEEVSEQIGRLQKLRMLDLGHNKLTRVPDALGDRRTVSPTSCTPRQPVDISTAIAEASDKP